MMVVMCSSAELVSFAPWPQIQPREEQVAHQTLHMRKFTHESLRMVGEGFDEASLSIAAARTRKQRDQRRDNRVNRVGVTAADHLQGAGKGQGLPCWIHGTAGG